MAMTRSISFGLHPGRLAAIALIAISATAGASAEQPCSVGSPFLGFDSRLRIDIAGRVPVTTEVPVSFEIVGTRPVVAYEHRVVAVDGTKLVVYPSLEQISALAVDRSNGVWLQSGNEVRRFGPDRMVIGGTLSGGARIHNSGAGPFLITRFDGEMTRLAFRAPDGTATPALDLQGAFRAASWNHIGLAAVVDYSLIVWPAGARDVTRLGEDNAFRDTRDVTLIGADRAVLTLSNLVVLQTDKGRLVLAAMRARARWHNGALFLLDEGSGVIWKVEGLEGVGTPASDFAHAARLVQKVPDAAFGLSHSPAFKEAARIVGCEAAREMRR
jgi:hypothetical protein